jgi:PAS domain S-box-containing protein
VTVDATFFQPRPSDIRRQFNDVIPYRGQALEQSRWTQPLSQPDLICTHDLEGRLLSVNRAACEALGMTEPKLRGTAIQELLPERAASGFAAYLQNLTSHSVAAGKLTIVTHDGRRRIWEYRTTMDTNDTQGAIARGVARDVTELEAAFKAVRNSEEQFRSIIENTSDLIAILELDGVIRYESPSVQRVLGYPADALVGRCFLELVHPDDAARAAAFLACQIDDPSANCRIELRGRHYRGSWRSFEIIANSLVKNGEASAIVVNARDITERKLLEAQLLQANRLSGLGRLAATVAHEFNNVLMGIQPFAELMQRPDATPLMISKGAGHIANSVQRGRRIVLDILRFTQPYVPITAAVELAEWWKTFAPEAGAVLGNMISVVSAIPDGIFVLADRTQLSQVLANLVSNARDALSPGGRLIIEANELAADTTFPFGVVPLPDQFIHIAVTDTGHGMSAEVMERVFEPLYTTRTSGGTGLGLAVAHQVVTQHGGYIFVESEEGRGTTFHIFLPRAIPPSAMAASLTGPAQVPTARKLLIIEDEEAIIEGISILLAEDGIEVEGISSGSEAVEAVGRFRPDFILLDYGLPGMDGSEVYALIRSLDSSLPIIFATGHGDRRVLHDRLNDPCTRFLQKPFEISDLLAMMVELDPGVTP